MQYVREESYDVVVCGSGPAGLGASMAAKKCGSNVIILESLSLPGGTLCAVPWMAVNRLLLRNEPRSDVHGAFVRHILKYGDIAAYPTRVDMINGDGYNCTVEYTEAAIYDMLEEAQIPLRMYSPVTGVLRKGDVITGVTVREKQGMAAYRAKVVVDATGDGDVAAAAGCEFQSGREEDGIHMPISLGFAIGGVDVDVFFEWMRSAGKRGVGTAGEPEAFHSIMDDAHGKGYYVATWYGLCRATMPGVIGVNNGAWRNQKLATNGTDSAELTGARRNGVRVALDFPKILGDYKVPGAENAYIQKIGSLLGVRDTRRIVGAYMQTLEDAETGSEFDDVVARKYGAVDANQIYIGKMKSGYAYPYRSLLPNGVEQMLVAGRCASATFMGHASGKSMGNMMELGIAAGCAAAMSAESGQSPRNLDVDKLQKRLCGDLGLRILE